MTAAEADPRSADEWRVEVNLEEAGHGQSLGERLRTLDLDNEARERLGGSVIVTRDGPILFLYAWHEESAHEAERVVRELMEEDGLVGEVRLMRWHPVADDWRPVEEPLPRTESELAEEQELHRVESARERRQSGQYPWEVVIHLPDLRSTRQLAHDLDQRGLPVKRRWRYILIGVDTEDAAIGLGRELEEELSTDARVGIQGNPEDMPHPVFVQLGSLKPGLLRDLGL